MMLAALSTYHAGMPQVVIVGEPGAPDSRALARVVHRRYMPSAVIVPISSGAQGGAGEAAALDRAARHARRPGHRIRLPRLRLRDADILTRRTRQSARRMEFSVDIWLRGDNHATTAIIAPVPREPRRVDGRRRRPRPGRDAAGARSREASARRARSTSGAARIQLDREPVRDRRRRDCAGADARRGGRRSLQRRRKRPDRAHRAGDGRPAHPVLNQFTKTCRCTGSSRRTACRASRSG